jgi:hypothetical protein
VKEPQRNIVLLYRPPDSDCDHKNDFGRRG